MDLDTRHFRAGVGTVIYTKDRKIAWFERAMNPVGVWQFQQGGIDCNETPEITLWRELSEEVGLTRDDIQNITEYPKWTVHPYPDSMTVREDGTLKKRIGQTHRWFFLELKDDVVIDLAKASEAEFSDWKWINFSQAIEEAAEHKASVYQELFDYFEKHIV